MNIRTSHYESRRIARPKSDTISSSTSPVTKATTVSLSLNCRKTSDAMLLKFEGETATPSENRAPLFLKHPNSEGDRSSVSIAMAKSSFKLEHTLERRKAESGRIREKYADRIPVIVEKAERSDIPDIDKKKYLVPADLTVGQFVYVVRKRINLSAEKAIFVFVKNTLPPTAALMSAIYKENKDEDGFLYMTYSGENTFGSL
ncbi:hypothetical protein RHGRI_004390 [Rhododendron griersonianum]|uniref:Autophagy-related protein n=2 Tax=Rhododendron TaxID=4346 RepID=A0AAV6LBE2_9ERIC|nr:hypothetical protein RHGRI_004390 [Rhododendron griersonianum]